MTRTEERLGELSWVLREWGKSFAGLLAELLVVFSVVCLLLRLLMRFFHWPNSLFGWLVARVSVVFGIAARVRLRHEIAATWRRFYLRRILPQVVTLIRRAR